MGPIISKRIWNESKNMHEGKCLYHAHNGEELQIRTTTTTEYSGTMTMQHGGRQIILKGVQYHPRFCNLISGQKLRNFSLICDNNGTRLETDKEDTLYHISQGINGTM